MKDILLVPGRPVSVAVRGKDRVLYTGIIRLHPTRPFEPALSVLAAIAAVERGRPLTAADIRRLKQSIELDREED